ncbi:MAG: HDOD domain-containing protein [Planctomycetota bacterium]|jgi:putative nucleotidyltransferase with HDIG domain
MRKILFVDNDLTEDNDLKKALRDVCPEWEIESAVGVEEAFSIMSKSPFDVVVSEILINGMDGIEFLSTVNDLYPETVRILHTKLPDHGMALKSTMVVHQLLMKPCSVEIIEHSIERTCRLRDTLRNETLKKVVTGIKNLPSLPSIYNLIVAEMQSPEGSLNKVGHLISQDVSMSAKIIQLVNSAFFSLPRKITDPHQAAVYVGIETLKSLVLSIHVFSSFSKEAELCGFSPVTMWNHCLRTSRLAADIARAEKANRNVVEGAMLAGMLHDIGKLIMLKIPKKYNEVMSLIETTGCSSVEAEYTVMDTSHAELGAYLLGLWGLPDSVVESVAFHHKPSKLIESMSPETSKVVNLKPQPTEEYSTGITALTAVHVANALIMQENCSIDTASFPYVDMLYLEKLGLTDKLSEWVDLYENTVDLSKEKLQLS